jgi:hypothetical protein
VTNPEQTGAKPSNQDPMAITVPPGSGVTSTHQTPQQASEPTLAMNTTGAPKSALNITVGAKADQHISAQATALPGAAPVIPDVELQAEIGRGGMGVVYRGRQPYLDRRVAVKLLLVDPARGGEDFVKRFQREAKILAGLHHPHIVACYQAGVTAENAPYLVMEFIDGPNLKDHVARNGPLKVADAVGIIADMGEALGHANAAGIIHRDVKPENILLASTERRGADSLSSATATASGNAVSTATARAGTIDGAMQRPFPYTSKLVDLGLARPSAKGENGEMNLTMAGVLMGTPSTMAPEQFDDPDNVDFRADIYGLGCVLFHSLTGCSAFEAKTLGEILSQKVSGKIPDAKLKRPDLPPEVCDLLKDLLAHKRENRPQDYPTLIARCRAIQQGRAVAKKGAPVALIAGIAIAAAVIIGLAVAFKPAPPPAPTPTPEVTPPVAPPVVVAPVEPPADQIVFGAPQPLLRVPVNERLSDWKLPDNTSWSSSEETEDGITGTNGAITRPVQGVPLRFDGTVALTIEGKAKTDEAVMGVLLSKGETMTLSVKNLGTEFSIEVDLTAATPDALPLLQKNTIIPAVANLPFSIIATAHRFIATVGGVELDPVPLSSPPTAVLLAVRGSKKIPAEFAKLTVSYAK